MIHCSEEYRLKKMAKLVRGKDVLDIGYAQSPNSFVLVENCIGLDSTDAATPPNYRKTFKGDALDLPEPFEPSSFDTILAGEILEHLECPVAFLRNVREALRPGGRLILSTPNPHSPIETLCNVFLMRNILYTRDHITLYPQRWLFRILETAGFEGVSLHSGGVQFPFVGTGPLPSFGLIPFPRAFCYQTIAVCVRPAE